MEAIGSAASIISIIQLAGKVTALGYGYIGSVSRAAGDVEKLMAEIELLRKVLIDLNDCMGPSKQAGPSPDPTVLQTLDGALRGCFLELERLGSKLKRTSGVRGRLRKFIGSLEWPFKETETLQIMAQIGRHKDSLILALSKHHIALSKLMQEDVKQVGSSVKVFHHEFRKECAEQGTVRSDEKRKTILDWLYPGDMHAKHVEISNRRQGNTGQWLLESPQYQSWVEGKQGSRLLLGYGIPGAGKTFLSSLVIDNSQDQLQEEKNGVAYIYFEHQEQEHQRPEHILASLIKQLVNQLPTLPTDLEKLHSRLKHSNKLPTASDLYGILAPIFGSFGRVVLVFDALDECNKKTQRNGLLPLFHQMGKDGANLFLTSRQHPEDIQESFRDVSKIELSAQGEDIRRYIQKKINESPRAKRLVEKVGCEERIISELIGCANGMFLLVAFHIEYLCQQTTPNQLKLALETLKAPSAAGLKYPLDPTYDRVMKALQKKPECCSDLAIKVFAWLVKAKRTLTIQEIQIAISVEPRCFKLDKQDVPDSATILDVCGGLVTVDHNSGTIRLAHLTVQEYLIRKSKITRQMDITLATTCVTYLSFDVFSDGACESRASLESRLESHPFFEYAAEYLPSHLNVCEEYLSKDIILDFLKCSGNMGSWIQVVMYLANKKRTDDLSLQRYVVRQTPLHTASSIGNVLVVQHLIEQGADVSEQEEGTGNTALYRAAVQGHLEVIRVLLENRASISTQSNLGLTALHATAGRGHQAVAQLLLENDIDIEVQNKGGETALHYAAYYGHQTVVQLLLEKGANTEVQDNYGRTALHRAAGNGHQAVVQLLLEKGADIEVQDNHGSTALYCAAGNGHQAVVQLLLENDIDIEVQNKDRETALHYATYYGHQTVVQLLLEKGADIEVQDNYGRTALHRAAGNGHQAVVQLLLENDIDIEVQNKDGETALHYAAYYGHQTVVQLLLEKGADIEVQNNYGSTALYCAAGNGHQAVVQMLLEKGADIEVQNKDGETALHIAAQQGHQTVVQLLLEKGADIEVQNKRGETALHIAAQQGHQTVVQLLENIAGYRPEAAGERCGDV